MSLFDLDGKVAVVTGSSRGIGRAIVERMAEHGAKVVVCSRKAEPCQEVADAINAKYGKGRAAAIPANPIATRFRRANFRTRYAADGGRASIGSFAR